MLSKSLIQFSAVGLGCVPSLLFDLRPNYGGGNEDNGDLLKKIPCTHCCIQCPQTCSRPPLTHASAWDSWTLMGMSGSVSCGAPAPFSWVLVCAKFCLCPPRVCFPVLCKFWLLSGGLMVISSKRAYAIPRSAAPRAPAPVEGHCWPVPPQETLKHSLSQSLQGLWVLVHTRFVWPFWVSLAGMRFASKCDFAPPIILLGLLLWMWGILFWWDRTFSCRWLFSSEL